MWFSSLPTADGEAGFVVEMCETQIADLLCQLFLLTYLLPVGPHFLFWTWPSSPHCWKTICIDFKAVHSGRMFETAVIGWETFTALIVSGAKGEIYWKIDLSEQ